MAFVFLRMVLTLMLLPQLFRLGMCDYCSNSLGLSSCPNLATYDQIDLPAYAGKWFEIGNTANSKNLMEAGGVCAEAQYEQLSSSELKVGNTEFITATPVATVSVGTISSSSAAVCQQARAICSQLNVNDSLLKQGLSKVWKFQSDIAGSYPTESGLVSKAGSKIQQASGNLVPQIDQLSTYVSQLQNATSDLSQTDGDTSSIVAAIQSTLSIAKLHLGDMSNNFQAISDAQLDLVNVAKGLFQKGGAAMGLSLTLTDAATEILGGAKVIQTQIDGMSTAFNTSTKAADAVLTDKSKPFYNVSSVSGTAAVNGSNAKLIVTFDSVPGKGKYWILAVDGDSSNGYNAALVYSCMDVLTGGADQMIWILSRKPTLSGDVVARFLSLASSLGVTRDCDAPFVFTKRSSKCPF